MRKNSCDENQVKDIFNERLAKVARLLVFAVENGYHVSNDIKERLCELSSVKKQEQETKENWTELDLVQAELTSVTYPITAETLSPLKQSKHYFRFQKTVIVAGLIAIVVAITSFIFIAIGSAIYTFGSIIALSLGLYGGVVYSLIVVLKVVSPSAFDSNDEYANYACLILGALLGWLVYFAFYIDEFAKMSGDWQTTLGLIFTFAAGLIAKLILGILGRSIYLLEDSLGIKDNRRRTTSWREFMEPLHKRNKET
jgi:hypothetical protein